MATKISNHLKESARERQDLNTVLSSINEGILAIESNKKIIFFNEKALQLLNNKAQNIPGEYYYLVIRNQHLNSLLNNFFEKPFLISDEIQIDSKRTLEVVIIPFHIAAHKRKGVVVVLRDISHYKKLEKIRRDFVANVSHEFKTPLAAIRGYSETLLDWALGDQTVNRKYVDKIIKQSNQLENLVADLLQLARIERLQNIELKAFDPGPVIQDVINEYSEMAQNKQIKLISSLQTKEVKILGDPEMFRSIMANLIDNAVKYTLTGGEVTVFSKINAKYGTFSVKDNGIGIPHHEQERVFERFYRVDKARSRAIGGTGLGLSIVKHLTELQQAEIVVFRLNLSWPDCRICLLPFSRMPKMSGENHL
jgi:two-component system phosphate regulon sensor histidine kinase PhoR